MSLFRWAHLVWKVSWLLILLFESP